MTAARLKELKDELLRAIPQGIGQAIIALKEALPMSSARINELIQLESRLKEANKARIKGIISQEDLDLRYNQIRDELILLIQSLELADFGPAAARQQRGRQGSLLYNIPDRMKLQEESKCIIRLAFHEDTIIENIELTPSVVLKTVRIAEVMQAELLDPNGEEAFRIRAISSEEQFLEEGAYTEWIFYVMPLREGTFPLLIKVSVVELVQGKERVREIVWEEEVEIITAATKATVEEGQFKSSEYSLQFGEVAPEDSFIKQSPVLDALTDARTRSAEEVLPPVEPIVDVGGVSRHVRPREAADGGHRPARKRQRNLGNLLALLLVVCVSYLLVPTFFEDQSHRRQNPLDGPGEDTSQQLLPPVDSSAVRDSMRGSPNEKK